MTPQRFSRSIEDYPDGIVLPIDKPYRWTSADVIRKVKYAAIKHFGKKNLKVGHAGTLDPLATGILLVCIGPATKRAEELQRSPKQYIAGVTFGATTPSYDLEKEIDAEFPLDGVSEQSVRDLLPRFIGEQEQVAPLFSAKSVDGVRAYEMARRMYREAQRNGSVFDHADAELLSRQTINIYGLELLDFACAAGAFPPESSASLHPSQPAGWAPPSDDSEGGDGFLGGIHVPRLSAKSDRIHVADISSYALPTATIRVDCSKGTYIRALARDLGEALGSGAFLSSLRRTGNGGFSIEDALSLEDVLALLAE